MTTRLVHDLSSGETRVVALSDAEIAEETARLAAAQAEAVSAAWSTLRGERDARLAACDWTELSHLAGRLDDSAWAAWASYRQALRDLPATTADPATAEWPEVPA